MTGLESPFLPTSLEKPRVAVLVDIENTSSRLAESLFSVASLSGDVVVRRGFADFSRQGSGWDDAISRHLITPVHQYASRKGKNSTDINLAVHAMDLLYCGHEGRIDVFCIVSSDGDFGALARRLREAGRTVVGIGTNPSAAFVEACTRFAVIAEEKTTPGPQKATEPKQPPEPVVDRLTDDRLHEVFASAFARLRSEDGWAVLAAIGGVVTSVKPGFKPKHYGFKKLRDLVASLPGFEVKSDHAGTIFVRMAEGSAVVEDGAESDETPASERIGGFDNVVELHKVREADTEEPLEDTATDRKAAAQSSPWSRVVAVLRTF